MKEAWRAASQPEIGKRKREGGETDIRSGAMNVLDVALCHPFICCPHRQTHTHPTTQASALDEYRSLPQRA
jgi:hypothetical protein